MAADLGKADFVESLLNAGASLDMRGAEGWTPLHAAAVANHLSCVEILVAYGADVNEKDQHGNTLLHDAADGGNVALLQLLLKSPLVDVNVTRDCDAATPLIVAAYAGYADVVRLLLAVPEIDSTVQDEYGQTAADVAEEMGNDECVALLAAL